MISHSLYEEYEDEEDESEKDSISEDHEGGESTD